jgi:hypothetical protein
MLPWEQWLIDLPMLRDHHGKCLTPARSLPISGLLSDAIAVISTLERRELEFEVAEASQPAMSKIDSVNSNCRDDREEGVRQESSGGEG